MGYNKTIIEGHLTRDIEMKYTQAGSAIANTAIAVSRKFKTTAGEQKEEVLFVDIAFFGRTAEVANQFLRRGSHVLVDGRLKLDQWTAQDGSKRSKHSITVENMTMLGNKDDAAAGGQPAPQGGYGQPQPGAGQPVAAPQGYTPPPQGQSAAGYGQPAPHNAPPPQGYNPPSAQPAAHQPPAGQPAGQPGQPQIIGYAPNGAPIFAQPGQPAGATP